MFIICSKGGVFNNYALLVSETAYLNQGNWESTWGVSITDVAEDATKFYTEEEALKALDEIVVGYDTFSWEVIKI